MSTSGEAISQAATGQRPGHAPRAQDQIAALKRLHELSIRLLHLQDMPAALGEVLDAAIELVGADMGNVQWYDEASGALRIVVQRGFKQEFLERFAKVDASEPSACGRTLRAGRRILIEDVETDPEYAPLRGIAARAGYRSVQSTPLIGSGKVLGVLSTHWREVRRASEAELYVLDLYAHQAALTFERLAAAQRVRETERRYHTLFESIDQGCCVLEVLLDRTGAPADYRFLECNPMFEQHTGLVNAQGRRVLEMVPDLEPWWIQTYGRVALSGEPARFTFPSQAMHRWFDVHAFRFGAPKLRQVALFFKDVTATHLAEARDRFLIALEDATRALIEPEEIATTATRLLGEHLQVNRAAYTEVDDDEDGMLIVGEYSPHQASILGRYRIGDYGQRQLAALRDGQAFVMSDVARSDLSDEERRRFAEYEISAMVQVPLLKHGRLRSTLALYQNTPRHWRAEEIELLRGVANRCWEAIERARTARALRTSEEQFRTLANLLPQFIWIARPDGYIYWFNDYAHAFFGESAQIEGAGWMRYHDPELMPEIERGYVEALQAGSPYACTTRFRNQVGEYRWFMARMVPQRDAQGNVLRFLGYNFDVTELYDTQAKLVEADRRKDEFLATLAHELRNPLAPLYNVLEILKLKPGEGIKTELREMMQRQVHHLGRLVDDLLDASRITRGVIDLQRARIPLGDALSAAIETSQPLIEARSHRLRVDAPAAPIWLHADAVRLTQVFANLLNNAAKYTDDHGRIGIRVTVEDRRAVIEVSDNGIGIAPDMLARVFELFTQVDRNAGRTQGGLGIGLSLSRRLVQMHGGTLEASSAGVGQGSRFTVRLPLAVSAGAGRESEARHENASAKKHLRLLVIDDNVDAAASLGFLLESLGGRVHVTYDGAAGLAALEQDRFAAAFIDLGMPDMDGLEVARRIRRQKRHAGLALAAVTGWGQDEDRVRSREAGFDHHLVKPADLNALQAVLKGLSERL